MEGGYLECSKLLFRSMKSFIHRTSEARLTAMSKFVDFHVYDDILREVSLRYCQYRVIAYSCEVGIRDQGGEGRFDVRVHALA